MKKLLTIIIDGFGMRGVSEDNAVSNAQMHIFDEFFYNHPHTLLEASGEAIGLLKSEVSNCAFSHKALGSGKRNQSNKFLINEVLLDDEIDNKVYLDMVKDVTKKYHLIMFSDEINTSLAINLYIQLLRKGIKKIYFHIICRDGENLEENVTKLCKLFKDNHIGNIISICGEDYAYADEDNLYYESDLVDSITKSKAPVYNSLLDMVSKLKASNLPLGRVRPFLLYEKKEITSEDIIVLIDYNNDISKPLLNKIVGIGAQVYSLIDTPNEKIKYFVSKDEPEISLGKYLSKLDIKQARVTTDEHMQFLTDDFDMTKSDIDQFGIPVNSNYEANCVDITHKVIDLMDEDYDFIVVNFPLALHAAEDMDLEGTINAFMSIDICLGKILEEAEDNFYTVIVTADHGNAENLSEYGNTHAEVPFVISDNKVSLKDKGDITSFAPTVLDYLDISIPDAMTSESLIK